MIQYCLTNPLLLVLVGSQFVFYAFPSWGVVLYRGMRGKWTRTEGWLLFILLMLFLIEFVQLRLTGMMFEPGKLYGVSRYFGVLAPLLWIWGAKLLSSVWNIDFPWQFRFGVRVVAAVCLAWMFMDQGVLSIRDMKYRSIGYDVEVASARAASVIRRDYAGPREQTTLKRNGGEYYTGRRPVVFSDYGAVAWMLRSDSEGALGGVCPYASDYLFVRVGSGYRGMDSIDPKAYVYVTSVMGGLGTEWRLFRRRTTSHK